MYPIRFSFFIFSSEYESYLPQCSESMVYSHKQQKGSSISLFKGSEDHLIFVGGPVWSMDWAPISNRGCRCSYVAMANYRTYNEVGMGFDESLYCNL